MFITCAGLAQIQSFSETLFPHVCEFMTGQDRRSCIFVQMLTFSLIQIFQFC